MTRREAGTGGYATVLEITHHGESLRHDIPLGGCTLNDIKNWEDLSLNECLNVVVDCLEKGH